MTVVCPAAPCQGQWAGVGLRSLGLAPFSHMCLPFPLASFPLIFFSGSQYLNLYLSLLPICYLIPGGSPPHDFSLQHSLLTSWSCLGFPIQRKKNPGGRGQRTLLVACVDCHCPSGLCLLACWWIKCHRGHVFTPSALWPWANSCNLSEPLFNPPAKSGH